MLTSRANELAVGRSLIALVLAITIGICTCEMAQAAERTISAQTNVFDCSSVKAGDTLTLPSGTRGQLIVRNCKGTSSNPIIIRNDPNGTGPAVISRSSGSAGGFLFSCNDCIGVKIDGSHKWRGAPSGKTYGIKVTISGGAAPTTFLKVSGLSRFVTIRNVEIDGKWPAIAKGGNGIDVNDHVNSSRANPGLWREGILIEHNFVHDIANSGMYIGPNYRAGDLPLRNIEIRFNRVEDTGFEGISTKAMWSGNNSIHHNEVRRAGKNGSFPDMESQYTGIKILSGTGSIYNNWIETTGQHGIQSWTQEGPRESEGHGPFEARIWNNVIVDAGGLWRPFMLDSFGISVGAQDGCEKPIPYVYNNTIVGARNSGIGIARNVGAGYVRDNVIAGAGGNPVIFAPGNVPLTNNRIGTITQLAFVDSLRLDFRLSVNSPAWNQGSGSFPPTDFDDVGRPKDGSPDQGAFEGKGR